MQGERNPAEEVSVDGRPVLPVPREAQVVGGALVGGRESPLGVLRRSPEERDLRRAGRVLSDMREALGAQRSWDDRAASREPLTGGVRRSAVLHFALVAVLTVVLSLVMVSAMFHALRRWL